MATDSMTAKIIPNGRGNPMTSIEHERFSDQEIAQAATSTRIRRVVTRSRIEIVTTLGHNSIKVMERHYSPWVKAR
jgi:hypothetical protein